MMYRRNAAQTPRTIAQTFLAAVAAVLPADVYEAVFNAAWRENRRRSRFAKRHSNSVIYGRAGLNGPRAVARRLRAIKRTGRLADGRMAPRRARAA